jgi:hypothetical protein
MHVRTACFLFALVAISAVPAGAQRAHGAGAGTVDPSIADGSAQRQLNAARRNWNRNGPSSYTYRLQLSCFCQPEVHTFVVRRGKPRHPPRGFKDVDTAPRLFKLVRKAIDDRVDGLHVTYYRNGALKELSVDQTRMAVDDEYTYTVDRFRRLR